MSHSRPRHISEILAEFIPKIFSRAFDYWQQQEAQVRNKTRKKKKSVIVRASHKKEHGIRPEA
jgi:hypothetical protein